MLGCRMCVMYWHKMPLMHRSILHVRCDFAESILRSTYSQSLRVIATNSFDTVRNAMEGVNLAGQQTRAIEDVLPDVRHKGAVRVSPNRTPTGTCELGTWGTTEYTELGYLTKPFTRWTPTTLVVYNRNGDAFTSNFTTRLA